MTAMPTNYPNCWQGEKTCFAYFNGRCSILRSSFHDRQVCPYYKTKAQLAEEQKQTARRLGMTGKEDLIRKYEH
jgi:hypothetical protein